ncbi:hypothetical protein L1F30_00580 [Simiduia sp. 21SJ11W-1]|uniref:hypothetical protein n=1 Tax=Simiduia sp. 21SJ11W-1 TaxID=2909669 RepID=UPI00209FB9FD|nr:hypothetical protein [Simiduia sp. 21SJ11W-1]UTA48050.1 hypothetical protein L1F30_00580 [Simiduia sp. 21SJ11W-1]
MIKIIAASALVALSSVAFAEKSDVLSMEIQDGKLSEAVALVNGYCQGIVDTVEVKNPNEVLSLKLENISCKDAASLLTAYDAGKA